MFYPTMERKDLSVVGRPICGRSAEYLLQRVVTRGSASVCPDENGEGHGELDAGTHYQNWRWALQKVPAPGT